MSAVLCPHIAVVEGLVEWLVLCFSLAIMHRLILWGWAVERLVEMALVSSPREALRKPCAGVRDRAAAGTVRGNGRAPGCPPGGPAHRNRRRRPLGEARDEPRRQESLPNPVQVGQAVKFRPKGATRFRGIGDHGGGGPALRSVSDRSLRGRRKGRCRARVSNLGGRPRRRLFQDGLDRAILVPKGGEAVREKRCPGGSCRLTVDASALNN